MKIDSESRLDLNFTYDARKQDDEGAREIRR